MDAISDDGAYGMTTIAFIGSVFSPYYAWSKKRNPFNHCAINVALYGPRQNRWAMTERGAGSVTAERDVFQVGPSALSWDGKALIIDVSEMSVPVPRKMRGRIRVTPEYLNPNEHIIDDQGKHRWQPVAPRTRVDVAFDDPGISWSGRGYFDSNNGDEPLESAFRYWDWSRAVLPHGETAIFYNTDLWNGTRRNLAIKLDASGETIELINRPEAALPPTKVWRIARRTRADENAPVRVLKTLEDTPFYSRSIIESTLFGAPCKAVHETLSGARFRSPIVKAMLPFRMPRIP